MTDEHDQPEDETSKASPEETSSDADAPSEAEAPSQGAAPNSDAASEPDEAPKKIKKSKKAKKGDAAEKLEAVDDSPEGRQLREAQVAFEIGDYKTARAIASKLAGHERAVIADGARDVLRRTDVDPAQMIFLAACLCALIGVAFYYLR